MKVETTLTLQVKVTTGEPNPQLTKALHALLDCDDCAVIASATAVTRA